MDKKIINSNVPNFRLVMSERTASSRVGTAGSDSVGASDSPERDYFHEFIGKFKCKSKEEKMTYLALH